MAGHCFEFLIQHCLLPSLLSCPVQSFYGVLTSQCSEDLRIIIFLFSASFLSHVACQKSSPVKPSVSPSHFLYISPLLYFFSSFKPLCFTNLSILYSKDNMHKESDVFFIICNSMCCLQISCHVYEFPITSLQFIPFDCTVVALPLEDIQLFFSQSLKFQYENFNRPL